ncbi:MAG: LPP20 family lipoprotein [Candidatus Cloacimonetes bacterium]|nr:LPP20 family lipoprotein [Candidatus Cloacimonadota bacterium]
MKKYLIMIILLLLLLSACAGNKAVKRTSRPAWLDDPESKYPNTQYITAIGSGFSRSDAEKDAAAKLSRIFSTQVEATETMEKRYEELTKNSVTSTEDYARSIKNITLSTSESLINMQFGESYTDNQAKVHAIAYLNRFETAGIYEEMISANSGQINYYTSKSKSLTDALDIYAYYGAAWMIASKNEDLLRQYRIISPQMSSMYKPEYDNNAIKNSYVKAARAITFSINIAGDDDNRIKNIIKRIITAEGFQISDDKAYISASGSINMALTDLKRDDATIFYRWEMSLNLTQPDGNTILSLNPSGRAGSISKEEARARVYIDIEKKLDKTIISELNSWFDNLVIKAK